MVIRRMQRRYAGRGGRFGGRFRGLGGRVGVRHAGRGGFLGLARATGRGGAGGLVDLQLAETAIDGVLDAGLVAGEFGQGVRSDAIGIEGAGQAVAIVVLAGWDRQGPAAGFGELFI
jgi:hypothetical protein